MLARLSVLSSLLLAPLLAPSSASAEAIVIEKGSSVTVSVPFTMGNGVNSNPRVIKVTPDVAKKTLVFEGVDVGQASYAVHQTGGAKTRIEYEIHVVEEGGPTGQRAHAAMETMEGERRERVMDKIETVRIARMTDALQLDSATAEKLFPAVRPFSERRAAATRTRGDAGKALKGELDKGTPDAKILTAELDRFAAAQKEFNDAGEEEYAVLKKVLDPVTLARYYQFQREFEHEVRGLLNEFREENPAKEKREKWEQRQKAWDRQNREDRQMEKGSR